MSAVVLLLAVLGCVAMFVRRESPPPSRRARYARWMARAVGWLGLPVPIALALLGRLDALWHLPAEFDDLRASLPAMTLVEVAGGAVGGATLGLIVAGWRARRGGKPIGRPGALMPRSRGELPWGAGVAVVAGVVEEPFFRLLLPLLIALACGSAMAGFGVATAVFAGLHRYQGWRGVIATGAFGVVMTAIYLISGALWLVVVLHVLIDLGGLVLWPALSSSAASRSGRSR